MKLIYILPLLLILTSCKEQPLDEATARKSVEQLIYSISDENFNAAKELFAPSFLESEPMEQKIPKLQKLNETLGTVQSAEFINSLSVAEFGEPQKIILEYKVVHSRVTTREKFTVVEEEGGYKISSYSVETES